MMILNKHTYNTYKSIKNMNFYLSHQQLKATDLDTLIRAYFKFQTVQGISALDISASNFTFTGT